ncbi:hypothetical protein TYRP_015225 [Tyrophagus putrescentiae]|nr:hypothetical protein TYRP_015225 [Tyrophagus putrescentiae]
MRSGNKVDQQDEEEGSVTDRPPKYHHHRLLLATEFTCFPIVIRSLVLLLLLFLVEHIRLSLLINLWYPKILVTTTTTILNDIILESSTFQCRSCRRANSDADVPVKDTFLVSQSVLYTQ